MIKEFESRLIEREQLSRIILLSFFSKSHMFLIGDRGVGKSHAIRLVNDVISDVKTLWQIQGNKSTTMKQMYGQETFNEDGNIQLNTKGTLLDSEYAFIDEVFKIDGLVLNGLLELLSDGCYTMGDGEQHPAKTKVVFMASNEYPLEKFMEPFVDRIIFWVEIKRISQMDNRLNFYRKNYNTEPIVDKYFSTNDLENVYKSALNDIEISPEIYNIYYEITTAFITAGVKTSDRKYGVILDIMKISAYLNNRESVDYSDLFILLHTAWHNDVEKEKVYKILHSEVFKTSEYVESTLEKIKVSIEEQETHQKGHLFDILNYKVEFSGRDKEIHFGNLKQDVITIKNNFKYVKSSVSLLNYVYEHMNIVLGQLEDNIFLLNITTDLFSSKSIDLKNRFENKLEDTIHLLKKWKISNKTLYEYNANRNSLG